MLNIADIKFHLKNEADMTLDAMMKLAEIRRLVRDLYIRSYECARVAMEQEDGSHWQNDWPKRSTNSLIRRLVDVVDELDSGLQSLTIDDEIKHEFKLGGWTLGRECEFLAPKKVLRGFLNPIRDVPANVPLTLKVFAFLSINGCKDLLDRHLHQGIHYHYALSDGTHTTTMICFDTRRAPISRNGQLVQPLFHELHARGAKNKKARPERWREEKRESIWDACKPDLARWPIQDFRSASYGASPVWPL